MKLLTMYSVIFVASITSGGTIESLYCEVDKKNKTLIEKVQAFFKKENTKEKLKLATGLRSGHSKYSSKNNMEPSKIYFSLLSKKFISSQVKKNNFVELKYFLNGTLSLEACGGSSVKVGKSGHFD